MGIKSSNSIEIGAIQAPVSMLSAVENSNITAKESLKKERNKKLKNKPTKSDGQIYQAELMNPEDIVAPYQAVNNSLSVTNESVISVAYSTLETAQSPSLMSVTPFCTTLSIDTLYTLSNTVTGGAYCFHFQVPARSKTSVFLINQAVNNDMRLTLYRHEADNTLTNLGQSDNPGNGNEQIIALTEAGDYYWYMEAIDVDGSSFNFAAVVNNAIDDYELNDTPSLSTALPDRFNKITASMDSSSDIDYFNFTAVRGQDIRFLLNAEDGGDSDEWLFDYYNGSNWARLGTGGNDYVLNGIPVGYTLHVRVYPNASYTVNPNRNYQLSIGSTVRQLTYSSVEGENTVLRVPLSATYETTYLTTQAYRDLTWSVRLADSTGAALEGETVNFIYKLNGFDDDLTFSDITNSSGIASGSVNLGVCDSRYTSGEHYSYDNGVKSWWITTYNFGGWYLAVPNAFISDELGVGSPEATITLGHLCKQYFQRSEY